jgi:hypothetical protein
MKRIALILTVVVLWAGGAVAQQNPTAMMEGMIRQHLQERAQCQQNESMRLELERRRLQQQLEEEGRYRGLSDLQVLDEIRRYCQNGEPPCPMQPPQSLIQEALRRGLIEPAPTVTAPTESGPTTMREAGVAPSPAALGKSKVVGGITCQGSRSPGNSIEIAITGEIDLITVKEVKKIFDAYDTAPRSCRKLG